MRRRRQKYLPIVLVALTVQILAPVAASWAATMVASDPFGAAVICHSLPASDPAQDDQSADHRAHDGVCPICSAVSLDAPQAAFVAMPYRALARVVWHEAATHLATSRIGSNSQARAPPQAI